MVLSRLGNYDEAIKSFNTVVGLRRDYASAWYERARINIRIGNTQDSLYDLRQAIRIGKEPYRMKAIEEKEFESLAIDLPPFGRDLPPIDLSSLDRHSLE